MAFSATNHPLTREGLYDPADEHDACGLGFIARLNGGKTRAVVADALELLTNLAHRGAAGADPETGDGAGILTQLPHAFLRRVCREAGISIGDAGSYGVGMVFLPVADARRRASEQLIERAVTRIDGWRLLGWRHVPSDARTIGETARLSQPVIRQFFVARAGVAPTTDDDASIERALFVLRKRIERELASAWPDADRPYVASLSSRTIIYKGMLHAEQLGRFYLDLQDDAFTSAIAVVHSRFSTNTFPSWALAHPYRLVAHNGEINTIRGNVRRMMQRESALASPNFPSGVSDLSPVVLPGQSDSASLDNVLELLTHAGRPLPHAMAMLMPEAWEGNAEMPAERRAFYEYHASVMEPWDGPAAVLFCDGRQVGATLDRNGLRPIRYLVTDDETVILASETGALTVDEARVRAKGQLQPGEMLIVNTVLGKLLRNDDVKSELASRHPYRRWIDTHRITLADIPAAAPPAVEPLSLGLRQRAFGYTREELSMVLAPMASHGEEAVGSMGNDAPLAVLSDRPQLLFSYFRQSFAQVTNPPIDAIREKLVMSLATYLGPQGNLLHEDERHARQVRLEQPVLTPTELTTLETQPRETLHVATISLLFDRREPAGLERAIERLCDDACEAAHAGAGVLILSDRGVTREMAAMPTLLSVAAVTRALASAELGSATSLVVEAGDARDVSHVALLIGYGASAVCPYLALESVASLATETGLCSGDTLLAQRHYVKALGKGLLKVLSKLGISTLQSYQGAQLFEAIGLGPSFVERYFSGTPSPIGGIEIDTIAEELMRRHDEAFSGETTPDAGSDYHYRNGGEHHQWNPRSIATLQQAARTGDGDTYRDFSRIADQGTRRHTLRGLLAFAQTSAVPIAEVEPASSIVRRFVTGAMSFGSLSKEAHETLALAMNRLGGRSNTGEGGEDRSRFGTERSSAVKQIASGRFGVTAEYLVQATELQIKMAQGAKPGEGGQLPGHKVDEHIAATRCATPGVSLISPPPHHDIYSIEDLKQLIHDLRNINSDAWVSVKLVAANGIGTIAAGVVKAGADLVIVSGDSGGTGAAPLSSIKQTGIPWEIGLAQVQQTLLINGLRSRVRLQTDGQLKTGRDVVVAALLGADEFAFATAPLIVEGCVMMRKCHLNTCPVGIATQDAALRAHFTGQPEHVINYFFFVAEEVRAIMAQLGARTLSELIGRVELLRPEPREDHWKARTLDLGALLHVPARAVQTGAPRRYARSMRADLVNRVDRDIVEAAAPALERGAQVTIDVAVRNTNRSTGTLISGDIARRFGADGMSEGRISVRCRGSAGQSFGAFAARGVELLLEGDANDYFGKGLSGGRLVVRAPRGAHFVPDETAIVGNTVLYGATSGEAFIGGRAGHRFAVRNSGATAVVEGVGDHGCEYMTGGVVVVLGRIGRNFGAGMSGGLAFVFDDSETGESLGRLSDESLDRSRVESEEHRRLLRHLVESHARYTGSARARHLLGRWEHAVHKFVAVVPLEFRRAVERQNASREVSRYG